ncbi:molybdopterin-dependent oxidoreductase [Leptolinea tardivitalis]|uniref:molybdopterin-dependent oxidoreductase n=1 Tax=Leptolinea tardivitalis TaxID=229920 RepID=UPI0007829513|nr:molybdopterin cofactor-binding domain-containing protein [Leptolinea tardivitalis]GAP22962.1 xanthine dehydrogenase, molybdenum binding subunit apoprotein [Leptolinea tardivitalis]
MISRFSINGIQKDFEYEPGITLLQLLRREGYFGAKYGGCSNGECGACAILLDGVPVNSCRILAAQAVGHLIETIEGIGKHPEQGWKKTEGLHPIQKAFIETGAIQCGYCTPAQVLAAKSLLERNINPTEEEIREALSGVLCRCTGYLKPIQAVMRAAAVLRGEPVPEIGEGSISVDDWSTSPKDVDHGKSTAETNGHAGVSTKVSPKVHITTKTREYHAVGKSEPKLDAVKLVQGKPAFTSDIELRGMLVGKILHSHVAHAKIRKIDTSKAKALKGVAAVLTWQDIPRVVYSTAGQSDPIPGPLDMFSLDSRVRFVGDRVAFVAAETNEIAEQALKLIDVEYEELPVVLDSSESMKEGTVRIHEEPEYVNFADSDPSKNLAAKIRIDIGDVDKGFSEADLIFEEDYEVQKVQQAHIEPHVAVSYWDEDDRLVIRTSTQVPFHARRILAPVLGLPMKRIRIIKPRVGGGFGGKQEILIEDAAAHLTIATGRPVLMEYTREEEFIAARSRHPMKIHLKTGVKRDGTITANEMYALSDTGAYGCHALTVTGNTGQKSMALYVGDGIYRKNPNIRFYADIVYTNHPPAGAFRGYGVPQGFWPVERQMEKIARALNIDPIEFRIKNAVRSGELHPFSTSWSEGREPRPEIIHTVGLEECIRQGKAVIGWDQKFNNPQWHTVEDKPYLRRGIGIATVMQGTAIPYLDMGGASIKLNDDGSFNLLVGATDLGTGSDTVLAQMAAEVVGVPTEDIICYSSDTDMTPFDVGAYASSTTYISGGAVVRAAEKVAEKLKERAAKMISEKDGVPCEKDQIKLADRKAIAPDGRCVSISEIAYNSLHHTDQEQIMAVASYVSPSSPPPFAAQFAEVTVDTQTGKVIVDNLVMAVDSGVIVNPVAATGQIEGGMSQALGYAVSEEMRYDEKGRSIDTNLIDYHIFRSNEMPGMEALFVETYEPSHPFGVKAVAEIPLDGVAPAVGNAVLDACNAEINTLPITPEKVYSALKKSRK